jgi:hypothetical protein
MQKINLNIEIDFEDFVDKNNEKIKDEMGDRAWFHEMGLTYNFL